MSEVCGTGGEDKLKMKNEKLKILGTKDKRQKTKDEGQRANSKVKNLF